MPSVGFYTIVDNFSQLVISNTVYGGQSGEYTSSCTRAERVNICILGNLTNVLRVINIIKTLLAYTITGRPSSLHCGPEMNIQIEHNIC